MAALIILVRSEHTLSLCICILFLLQNEYVYYIFYINQLLLSYVHINLIGYSTLSFIVLNQHQ